MGYRAVPWLHATYFFLVVQLILAMLTQMHRKDMITITVCASAFYMLSYPETTRRSQFRLLVVLIFVSIFQDVFWFALNKDTEDDEDDGGLEKGVKKFSRIFSFISFAWRVSSIVVVNQIRLDLWPFCTFFVPLIKLFKLSMMIWHFNYLCNFCVVLACYDPLERLLRLRGDR